MRSTVPCNSRSEQREGWLRIGVDYASSLQEHSEPMRRPDDKIIVKVVRCIHVRQGDGAIKSLYRADKTARHFKR